MSHGIYKLIFTALRRFIRRDRVVSVLMELIKSNPGFGSVICDVWSTVDSVCYSRAGDKKTSRDIFCQLTREMNDMYFHLFQERFDADTLPDTGIMTETKYFHQRFIRLKTKN